MLLVCAVKSPSRVVIDSSVGGFYRIFDDTVEVLTEFARGLRLGGVLQRRST